MAIAKEQLQQIIAENDIKSTADIYTLFNDSFKDILQELLEAELDVSLGYEKIIRVKQIPIISVTAILPKRSKHSMVRCSWISQETGTGSLNLSSSRSTSGISRALRRR